LQVAEELRFVTTCMLTWAIALAVSPDVAAQVRHEDLKILPTDGAAGDWFGRSVALHGNIAIVGARRDDDNGRNSGSAYLFETTTGTQIAKLVPADGAEEDSFGWSVAIGGTTTIVGAPEDDDNGPNSGSAYLFDVTTGIQIAKLLPTDGAAADSFGESVALDGTTAIVGACRNDDNGANSGSAYLFDTTTGEQIAKLMPSDNAAGDEFGVSVAISGTTAIVGAHGADDNGRNSGSAYLFDATTGEQIAELQPTDAAAHDYFGFSVAISDATAIVGAQWDDDNGNRSGSAYRFDAGTNASLEIDGICPGPNILTATGFPPDTIVAFLYSFARGEFEIPPTFTCGGTVLDLAAPVTILAQPRTDATGTAVVEGDVPPAACGRLFIQAIDSGTCATTNVVTR